MRKTVLLYYCLESFGFKAFLRRFLQLLSKQYDKIDNDNREKGKLVVNYDSDENKDEPGKTRKNILKGEEFKKLQTKAKKLEANRQNILNEKFVVELKESGKTVHFGNPKYEDYLIHKLRKDERNVLLEQRK